MSPITIWKVNHSDLERVDFPAEIQSLDQGTQLLPDGAYTTFRTYQGRTAVLRLGDHFDRLEQSAALVGRIEHLARNDIRLALRSALNHFASEEARVRIILDLLMQPGEIYLLIEPLRTPPADLYHDGVRVVTRYFQRENPLAKQTVFIHQADLVRHSLPTGVHEAVMVSESHEILEGLTSNFFGVCGGTLYTAAEGVLEGITRSLLLEVAAANGIPIQYNPILVNQITTLDEAFITSASRAVLPVVQIDDVMIGSGRPGQVTLELLAAYQARIGRELDTI